MNKENKKITNMTELRLDLLNVYERMKNKEMRCEDVHEINGVARNIIKTASVQLQYSQQRKETPDIEFLR